MNIFFNIEKFNKIRIGAFVKEIYNCSYDFFQKVVEKLKLWRNEINRIK